MFAIWFRHLVAATALGLLAACGGSDDDDRRIVERVQADARLSILAEALGDADLTDTLTQDGPYTVFAPTDDAFGALLDELGVTKDQLFADKALLSAVLSYHVLGARVERAGVPAGKAITALQGGVFKIEAAAGELAITDGRNRRSAIVETDIGAFNGVIHVVDRVLLPANRTIVETAQALPGFGILVQAVVAAGLADELSAAGPLTVFAPTDTAFAALLAELGISQSQLLADTALLTQVLTYHVVGGRVLKAEVPVGAPVTTLQGGTFTVDASLTVTDERDRSAAIAATDVFASNGVIHVIDKVILPAQ